MTDDTDDPRHDGTDPDPAPGEPTTAALSTAAAGRGSASVGGWTPRAVPPAGYRAPSARRPPSVVDLARGTLGDLGLGLGWLGIYFTASLALWQGRTPGKRLLGIRVVRIDGERLTTWHAFSRFGGYAASVFPGLLGFVQLLWDPNRQALQDQIAGTVVVREESPRPDAQPFARSSSNIPSGGAHPNRR